MFLLQNFLLALRYLHSWELINQGWYLYRISWFFLVTSSVGLVLTSTTACNLLFHFMYPHLIMRDNEQWWILCYSRFCSHHFSSSPISFPALVLCSWSNRTYVTADIHSWHPSWPTVGQNHSYWKEAELFLCENGSLTAKHLPTYCLLSMDTQTSHALDQKKGKRVVYVEMLLL